ncbi:MAG TPA: alpha/beta hydrolase [Nitrospiraceae bacterium]
MTTRLIVYMVGLLTGTLFGCQSTETNGGSQHAAPPRVEIKRAMAATMSRADADMRTVLNEFQNLGPQPIESLSTEDAREQPTLAQAVKEVLDKRDKDIGPQPIGRLINHTIPGPDGHLPVRLYMPRGIGPFPVIVYYHGGGWVVASIDTYDASARALANAATAIVVAVEYRKAPEHRFPAAHQDAFAAYQWALRHAGEFNGDPLRIAVAGESAGGNLAGAVVLMAREQRERLPVHQVLIYPVTGYDFTTTSYRENANVLPLNKAMMVWYFEKYLKEPADANSPWISLVDAPNLKGLSPATIITADIDPLRSDGRRYADRLREAGVPVTYQNFPGVTHEFFGTGAVVNDANRAVQLVAIGLQGSFGRGADMSPVR